MNVIFNLYSEKCLSEVKTVQQSFHFMNILPDIILIKIDRIGVFLATKKYTRNFSIKFLKKMASFQYIK